MLRVNSHCPNLGLHEWDSVQWFSAGNVISLTPDITLVKFYPKMSLYVSTFMLGYYPWSLTPTSCQGYCKTLVSPDQIHCPSL